MMKLVMWENIILVVKSNAFLFKTKYTKGTELLQTFAFADFFSKWIWQYNLTVIGIKYFFKSFFQVILDMH